MVPSTFMGGGSALSGDLSVVEAGLYDYRNTLDILHRAFAQVGHHRVWYGDTCFCDFCGGKGSERGKACNYCKGEGMRPSSVGLDERTNECTCSKPKVAWDSGYPFCATCAGKISDDKISKGALMSE